jgi:FAD dependent oxidoreductase
MAATRALHHAKPGAATGPPAAVFTPDRCPGRVHCQAMGRCGRLRGTGMNRVADAIVIGSGALGASTAFHLAARGRAVVLVDIRCTRGTCASPASGLATPRLDRVEWGTSALGPSTLAVRTHEASGNGREWNLHGFPPDGTCQVLVPLPVTVPSPPHRFCPLPPTRETSAESES